jgi:lysophospholipase L1-like esterase
MVGNNPATQSTFKDKDTEGWSGFLISEVDGKMRESMPRNRPNIATVLVGTNDMIRSIDVANAPARLGRLIDGVLDFPPLTLVVVSSLPPAKDVNINNRISAYNRAIPGVVQQRVNAGRSVIFADCGSKLNTGHINSDGIHPGDVGYEIIGKCFYDAIVAAEKKGWLWDVQGPAP